MFSSFLDFKLSFQGEFRGAVSCTLPCLNMFPYFKMHRFSFRTWRYCFEFFEVFFYYFLALNAAEHKTHASLNAHCIKSLCSQMRTFFSLFLMLNNFVRTQLNIKYLFMFSWNLVCLLNLLNQSFFI